jgi:hypothetical protein
MICNEAGSLSHQDVTNLVTSRTRIRAKPQSIKAEQIGTMAPKAVLSVSLHNDNDLYQFHIALHPFSPHPS